MCGPGGFFPRRQNTFDRMQGRTAACFCCQKRNNALNQVIRAMRTFDLILGILTVGFTTLAAEKPDFTLHEWGTFTSVSGSDGALLPGLETEEEALPGFVYSHDGMPRRGKGYAGQLHHVTIKMETPVIYFYASEPFAAHVHVGVNTDSISQWFPQRSSGETPPPHSGLFAMFSDGDIDFAKGFKGGIEWNVQV